MENNYNNNSGEENFLFGKDKKLPFVLPEGYFDTLSGKILVKMELQDELNEFKTLSSIDNKPPFALPEGYFESSQNKLEYKYELSAFEKLSSIPKPDFSRMEQNYFSKLEEKILEQTDDSNELKEFATLSGIKKQNEFFVAPDYFDAVADQLKEKYHAQKAEKPAVVVQMWKVIYSPKLAIAASIALIIGVTVIWYATQPDKITGPCQTLACLEKNEILNENNISDFDDESIYEMVDEEQLDKQMSDGSKPEDSLKMNVHKKQ